MKVEITFPVEDAKALHNLLKIVEDGATQLREALPEAAAQEYTLLSSRLGDTLALAYRLLGEKLEEAGVELGGTNVDENGYLQ